MSNHLNEEDPIKKLQVLGEKVQSLNARHTRLLVKNEESETAIADMVREMAALGTTPEGIDETVRQQEEIAATKVSTYEKEIQEFEQVIVDAERSIEKKPTDAGT